MVDPGATPTVRIFVSSPSDVLPERDRVDRIAQRLNAAFAGAVNIEAVRWETSAYTADSTFQRQIADPAACDLVVSIFWQRLGSELPPEFERMPDGRPYPSGTVYELTKALEANAKSGRGLPHVLVYRKTADAAVVMTDRERYRQAHEQREAFLAFWEEWFVTEQGHFKAAYNSFTTTDDFEARFDAHLREWLRDQGYVTRTAAWSLVERGSPFVSLEPFDARHEDVFFGRARDIDRAIERLSHPGDAANRRRFLLLIGESGSGKSSLARAGIAPRILRGALGGEAAAWRVAQMRPGAAATPLLALANAIFDQRALSEIASGDIKTPAAFAGIMASTSGLAAPPVLNALTRVSEAVRARLGSEQAPAGGLVIVIDQLEELFAPTIDVQQRERFADTLDELASSGRVVVIATLRSDAYADFARSPALLALKEAGATLDVTTPGEAEIAEIVRAPAAAAGLTFGPAGEGGDRLDDVVVRAASGRDTLPLLQFTLSRLYDAMRARLTAAGKTLAAATPEDLVLTYADYQAFGGLEGAIGERAEETFRGLLADAQARLPRLLRALAEVEAGDSAAAQANALRLFEVPWELVATDAPAAALAQALIDARILVASDAGDGRRRVRLAHEAVLRTWGRARAIVAEDRDFFRIRAEVAAAERRFARRKSEVGARGADAFLLPRGVPLAEAEAIRTKYADELAPELVGFIDQSSRRARRRQHLLAAASVVFALTAVGAGVGAYMANRSESRATRNFDLAIAQADALVSRIAEELKDLAVSRDALRRVLIAIERQFEEIARIEPDHPRLLLSRAKMLIAFVDNYLDLGETAEAVRRADECIAITRRLLSAAPDDLKVVSGLGSCLERLGTAQRDRGQLASAIAAYEESVALRRRLVAKEPGSADWRRQLADGLRYYGYALALVERSSDSLVALRECVAIAEQLAKAAPDDIGALRMMADSLNAYAIVLGHAQQREEALANYQKSAGFARRLIALDPGNANWKRYLSNILANSSRELKALGRTEEALAALQDSLSLHRALVTFDPGNMAWQRELSYILVEIGALYAALARSDDALAVFREAITIVRRLIAIDSGNVAWKNELRAKLPPVVELLLRLGNGEVAIAVLRETIVLWREAIAARPDDLAPHFELGWLAMYLGDALANLGRLAEADASYTDALSALRRFLDGNATDLEGHTVLASTLNNRGYVLAKLDRRDEARASLRESVAVWRRIVAEFEGGPSAIIELAATLMGLAAFEAEPRPLLEESLRLLRALDAERPLPAQQKELIANIERKLKALGARP